MDLVLRCHVKHHYSINRREQTLKSIGPPATLGRENKEYNARSYYDRWATNPHFLLDSPLLESNVINIKHPFT